MTIISAISGGSGDAFARLVAGLKREFGQADVSALAAQILDAEKAEFHWDSRIAERYLGQHCPFDLGYEDEQADLVRMAILSEVAGRWHAGVCIVDGDGCATECLWLRSFDRRGEAAAMFARAR